MSIILWIIWITQNNSTLKFNTLNFCSAIKDAACFIFSFIGSTEQYLQTTGQKQPSMFHKNYMGCHFSKSSDDEEDDDYHDPSTPIFAAI